MTRSSLLSLTATLSMGLAAVAHAQDPVTHVEYSGADLAEIADRPDLLVDGAFIVPNRTTVHLNFDAPIPTRSVGFWWDGDILEHTIVGVPRSYVTLVRADGTTDPTYPVVQAHDLSPDVAGETGLAESRYVSGLTHTYDDPAAGLTLTLHGPVDLDNLVIVYIAPPDQPARPLANDQGDEIVDPAAYPKPFVYSRASWGADPPTCNYSYCPTTHIAIHHTAGASEYNSSSWQESANNVKSIQAYHMYTRGWCDIGYNYLIDVHGYIFEGRGGGDNVRAAHDGYNCGSMGTSLMGYFHTPYNHTINAAMMDSIGELGAWKCDQQGIDPNGTSYYAGYGANMTNIYGHRNVASTACPGDLAYADLPQIRSTITNKLNGGGGGEEIILDNNSAIFTQTWETGTSASDKYGSNYRWRSTNLTRGLAYWRPNITEAGNYTVYFWWPQGSNRNPSAQMGVRINNNITSVFRNQQTNGGRWNSIGTFYFPRGTNSLVGLGSDGSGTYVTMADAIRLVKQ